MDLYLRVLRKCHCSYYKVGKYKSILNKTRVWMSVKYDVNVSFHILLTQQNYISHNLHFFFTMTFVMHIFINHNSYSTAHFTQRVYECLMLSLRQLLMKLPKLLRKSVLSLLCSEKKNVLLQRLVSLCHDLNTN